MKSGMRSIGLSAYAATAIAATFAYQGTRGSCAARYSAWTSRCIRRIHPRSLSLVISSFCMASNAGPVSTFIDRHFRHFSAAVLKDAANAYVRHLDSGGHMLVTLAGAMSTAELGLSL